MNWGMVGIFLRSIASFTVALPILVKSVYEYGKFRAAKEINEAKEKKDD